MKRILTLLVTVVVLLLLADRGSVVLAERALASRMQQEGVHRATAKVHGFPFLTQALRGRYDRVDVTATDIDRSGVRIASLRATLLGIQVPLGEVLAGEVDAVPVRTVDATAVVTYLDLAHRSGLVGMTLEPLDGQVRVTARVRVLGQTVTASSVSRVSLKGSTLVVTARTVKVLGQSTPAVLNALTGLLDLRVPIGRLPYGLTLTGVHVSREGVVLDAAAHDTVLTAG